MMAQSNDVPVVLDDTAASLRRLTDLGRWVVQPTAQLMRHALTLHASLKRWDIVDHDRFSAWALERSARVADVVVNLDPLIDVAGHAGVAMLSATRTASREGWKLAVDLGPELSERVAGSDVALTDDAAGSGTTLSTAAQAIRAAGGTIKRVVVAASGSDARDRVRDENPDVEWIQLVEGDHPAVHMRDACPCLPRAGRRMAGRESIPWGEGELEVRYAPHATRGGIWERIFNDRNVRQAMLDGRRQLVRRFHQALGRPPVAADVLLLGADVSVPVFTAVTPSAATPFESLLITAG